MLGIATYMKVTVSGLDMTRGKPHPDIYLKASELIGVPPNRCVAIEDSEAGVTSAVAAGMVCIAFPCEATRGQTHAGAIHRSDNLQSMDWEHLMFTAS